MKFGIVFLVSLLISSQGFAVQVGDRLKGPGMGSQVCIVTHVVRPDLFTFNIFDAEGKDAGYGIVNGEEAAREFQCLSQKPLNRQLASPRPQPEASGDGTS